MDELSKDVGVVALDSDMTSVGGGGGGGVGGGVPPGLTGGVGSPSAVAGGVTAEGKNYLEGLVREKEALSLGGSGMDLTKRLLSQGEAKFNEFLPRQ